MAECGTTAGYQAHRKRGEKCQRCLDAQNAYSLARKRELKGLSPEERRLRRAERPTVANLIRDVLESYFGEWLTTSEVVDRCVEVRPGVNPETVRDTLWRLEGVEHRPPDEWSRESRWRVEWRSYW